MNSSSRSSDAQDNKVSWRLTVALGDEFAIPEEFLSLVADDDCPSATSPVHQTTKEPVFQQPDAEAHLWKQRLQEGASSQALRALPRSSYNTDNSKNSAIHYPPGVEVILRNPVRNGSGSRFKEGISEKGPDTDQTSPAVFAEEPGFQRVALRCPTPPVNSGARLLLQQTPIRWDVIGAKTVFSEWIERLLRFRDEFKTGIRTYFNNWTDWFLFKGARKLLRATLRTTQALQQFMEELDTLSEHMTTAVQRLDANLRKCMQEATDVYESMMRESISAIAPLKGKELAWRRHGIKHALGPIMERIAYNLGSLQSEVSRIKRELAAEKFVGEYSTLMI